MNNTEPLRSTDTMNNTPATPLQKSPTSKERRIIIIILSLVTTSVKKRPSIDINTQRKIKPIYSTRTQ